MCVRRNSIKFRVHCHCTYAGLSLTRRQVPLPTAGRTHTHVFRTKTQKINNITWSRGPSIYFGTVPGVGMGVAPSSTRARPSTTFGYEVESTVVDHPRHTVPLWTDARVVSPRGRTPTARPRPMDGGRGRHASPR